MLLFQRNLNQRYGEGKNDESAVNVLIDPVMVLLHPPQQILIPRTRPKNQKRQWTTLQFAFPQVFPHTPTLTGTATSDVARVILDITTKFLSDPKTFHFPEILQFSAQVPMTKYDMALKFGEILGVPTDHIVRVDEPDQNAKMRPENSQLDVGRLKEMGTDVSAVDFEAWWRKYLGAYRH
jgi:hypothetical protein